MSTLQQHVYSAFKTKTNKKRGVGGGGGKKGRGGSEVDFYFY